jgi:MFS family permease
MIEKKQNGQAAKTYSVRSRFGLNAANFFQAEAVGVVLPILNTFLKEAHWRYDQIGVATALLGLGTLLFQTPAGMLVDRVKSRRMLFFVASIAVGICFGIIPFVPHTALWIDTLLFLSGIAQSIFIPVLGALALALVGYQALNRTLGENQGWNHAGNIVAALLAFVAVRYFGSASIFYSVSIASLVGAFSVYWMRKEELNEEIASGDGNQAKVKWGAVLRDRSVLFLLAAVALFHLANAPILPVTALYIKQLGGSSALTTFTVLSAQLVMVPVAWATGRLCDSWGRKPIMAVAFWVLPFRILSYTLAHNPHMVVFLQALDGIGAGIYSVAIVAFAADLTRGKGPFN